MWRNVHVPSHVTFTVAEVYLMSSQAISCDLYSNWGSTSCHPRLFKRTNPTVINTPWRIRARQPWAFLLSYCILRARSWENHGARTLFSLYTVAVDFVYAMRKEHTPTRNEKEYLGVMTTILNFTSSVACFISDLPRKTYLNSQGITQRENKT